MSFPIPLNSGRRALCLVFSMNFSNINTIEGSTVTQESTPKITPFAMTRPISSPRVKLIKQRAIKPATVVMELPSTETRVFEMACAIALLLSPGNLCWFSLKEFQRKME